MMARVVLFSLLFVSVPFVNYGQNRYDILVQISQPSILVASAGDDILFEGEVAILGGNPTATGGFEPYAYQWLPSHLVDDPTVANPEFNGNTGVELILVVTDSRGCQVSDTIQLSFTGVGENDNTDFFLTYPNPVEGKVNIMRPRGLNLTETNVSLYDASGKQILTAIWEDISKDLSIDMSQIAKGRYTLVLSDKRNEMHGGIIIK